MLPEARCTLDGIVSKRFQMIDKFFVSIWMDWGGPYIPRLKFGMDMTIDNKVVQLVIPHDFGQDHADRGSHLLSLFYGCGEKKVFYVHTHEEGIKCANDHVEK